MRIDATSSGRDLLTAVVPLIGITLAWACVAGAQAKSDSGAKHHSPVCAAGVRTYTSARDVPTPYETLALPPGPPIRVTPGEEAAGDQAMRARAGSGGATGMIVTETSDGGLLRRSVSPVFVPSDSARAHRACPS